MKLKINGDLTEAIQDTNAQESQYHSLPTYFGTRISIGKTKSRIYNTKVKAITAHS